MNRDQALAIVNQYVKNQNLVKHMLAVEAAMRFYARKYGEDEEKWAVTGLLHDFDWEIQKRSSGQFSAMPTIQASLAKRRWNVPYLHVMKSQG